MATERARAGISAADGAKVAGHTEAMQAGVYEQEWREDEEILEEQFATVSASTAALVSALAS